MDDQIIQHRMARGIIIEGGSGILPSEWTDVLERLDETEGLAESFNPEPLPEDVILSTITHGIGYPHAPESITMPANAMIWTPISLPRATGMDSMGVYVETPQAGAVLTLAAYNRSAGLAKTFGTVAADAVGWQFAGIPAPHSFPAGRNYLAVMSNGVSGVEIAGNLPRHYLHHDLSMNNKGAFLHTGTGGTPPGTALQSSYIYQTPFLAIQVQT